MTPEREAMRRSRLTRIKDEAYIIGGVSVDELLALPDDVKELSLLIKLCGWNTYTEIRGSYCGATGTVYGIDNRSLGRCCLASGRFPWDDVAVIYVVLLNWAVHGGYRL